MAKKRSYGVELVIRGKDLASATIGKVGRGLKLLVSPLRGIAAIGRGLGGLIEKIPGLTFLGVGVARLGGALHGLAMGAAEAGSAFNDLGAQTGIGTRALQEVAYAADQASVPFEEFQAGLRKMTATLGKGVGPKQLRMLGNGAAGFANALKKAKTPGEKFELILAQLADIPDATKRAAFGMTFFGKAGTKLAGLGAEGAKSIKAMRQAADASGEIMSDEEIKRADEFGDTWGALVKTFGSAKRDFGTGMIDSLLPDLKNLLEWTKTNRKEIGLFLKDLGRKTGAWIVEAAKSIKSAVEWIVANKADVIDVMEKVGIGVAALMGISALGPILSALATNPIFALIAAAVAGLTWLIANAPPAATQDEKDNSLVTAQKEGGTLGGAKATMGAAMRGNPMGFVQGIMDVGNFVSDEDQQIAEARDRQRASNFAQSDSFNRGIMSVVREAKAPGSELGGVMQSGAGPAKDQSIEVKVVVEDKGGNTDGAPKVKATPGVKASARTSNTRSPQSHLKGGVR